MYDDLADDRRPAGPEKFSDDEKYHIRQRNYRILYMIEDNIFTVTIVKVGHPRNIYS
jgi:mRNA interferase RelE/StbE